MAKYIYQYPNWPEFSWKDKDVQPLLGQVRHSQGKLMGMMSTLGFKIQSDTLLSVLTMDVVKSSEIEGEMLNIDQVRSSVARKLGIDYAGIIPSSRHIDGVVDMLLDATQHYDQPLDEERLFGWHSALFPTGRSGLYKITVGCYRSEEMQIVSGAIGNEKIHYQAPSPEHLTNEMHDFLKWFNENSSLDLVLKAAIAHFRFIIIHPFDDGNGRIARALTDLLLARSDGSAQRFYSLSSQILLERKKYYDVLQKCQSNSGDITEWIIWFLNCLTRSLDASEKTLNHILLKAKFWDKHNDTSLNARQRLMLNKILDGFDGKLKSSKWAKIAKCSADTALRDIKDLIDKRILKQESSGGRSTNYEIAEF